MRLQATDQLKRGPVVGRVGLGIYDERTGLYLPRRPQFNQIQDGWMFIAAQAIGMGLRSHRLQAMYIEFENVAAPEDPVTIRMEIIITQLIQHKLRDQETHHHSDG